MKTICDKTVAKPIHNDINKNKYEKTRVII
jgi:hypothetical protein